MVADFHEVPPRPGWGWTGPKKRLLAMLGTLRQPAPRYENEGYHLASLFCYLDENGIVDTEPEGEYGDPMMDLVENHGGAWALVEPRPERIDALDPCRFEETELRAFYEDVGDPDPGAGTTMMDDLKLLHQTLTTMSPEAVLLIRIH